MIAEAVMDTLTLKDSEFRLFQKMIYETAGNAHNDIVMAFFILLGIYALCQNRFTLAEFPDGPSRARI